MIDTTVLPERLQAIDRTVLAPLVRQLFRSDTVEVVNWHIDPINFYHVNPITIGLYRIKGTAHDNNSVKHWSMVLKIVQPPTYVSEASWKLPDSFAYMKREALAYSSDFRANLPDCIGMPRCFEMSEQPDNTDWLWMEEITDTYPSNWPLEAYAQAGRHLGIFNGSYLNSLPLPDYPWLSRNFLGTWMSFWTDVSLFTDTDLLQRMHEPAIWEQPMIRCAFPTPIAKRFLNLEAKSALLVNTLDRLPQTLCHLDANRANLFARCDEKGHVQTVMIDWAYLGINAPGLELVQLLWSTISRHLSKSDLNQLESVVYKNYLAGLREAGWTGDETIIRFGYTASVFCRQGLSRMNWTLRLALDEAQHSKLEQAQNRPISEILAEKGAEVYTYVDRGEEALRLLDTVSALL